GDRERSRSGRASAWASRPGPNARREFCPTMGIIAFERPATFEIKIKEYNLKLNYISLPWSAKSVISTTAALEISSAVGVNFTSPLGGRDCCKENRIWRLKRGRGGNAYLKFLLNRLWGGGGAGGRFPRRSRRCARRVHPFLLRHAGPRDCGEVFCRG